MTPSLGASPAKSPVALARVAIAFALAAGLAVRLAFAFGYWVGKPLTLDEQEYMLLAQSVARGDGLTYPSGRVEGTRHFERPPGFPLFLAAVIVATGNSSGRPAAGLKASPTPPASSSEVPAAIKVAQALMGLVCILLIAGCARQVAGDAAGVAAAWVGALYPPLAWISGYVLAETLYCALAFATVWLLSRGTARQTAYPGSILAAGVAAGAAVLTKEAMLFFVPLAVAWLLARRRWQAAVVLCVGVALVLAPWVARNRAVYGRFVLTAPHGGVTFWTGNNELATGEGDLAANPAMARARLALQAQHPGAGPAEVDNLFYADAWRFIRTQPARWVGLLGRKLVYTFLPIGPSYRLHSALYVAASLVSYLLIACAAIAGIGRLLACGRWRDGWAIWLLAASAVAMSLVFFPQERFRIPVIDPTLVICAAAWVGLRR